MKIYEAILSIVLILPHANSEHEDKKLENKIEKNKENVEENISFNKKI